VINSQQLERVALWLSVGVAVSLPWSTSATLVLVVLWLVAILPTMDKRTIGCELFTAAGSLPVALWLLAVLGMLWADVTWSERFAGFGSFNRLLAIPLLLTQFRRSTHGAWVLGGFLVSVSGVLILSWVLVEFPGLSWRGKTYGVPVKDYILQSEEFLVCAFVLFAMAIERSRRGQWHLAMALVAAALLFTANIVFVTTGRTSLVVAPVLLLLLGWRAFGWKGLSAAVLLGCVVGALVSVGSPYLRARLMTSFNEFKAYTNSDDPNSTGLHLEFLRKSLSFVETAPIVGHGTGSIPEQFRNSTIGQAGAAAVRSANPHNQILTVAIQLGLVGAAVLTAMWIAHVVLFTGSGLTAWIGMVVVIDNIVSSLFNSHLFDFTQGWLYVFGVGVVGGMVRRELPSKLPCETAADSPLNSMRATLSQ
jgi:O-antigen ligase